VIEKIVKRIQDEIPIKKRKRNTLKKVFKKSSMRKFTFSACFLSGFVVPLHSSPKAQDTVKDWFSVGKVQLKIQAFFQPILMIVTDRYIYTDSVDGFPLKYLDA
jgi:hypothetical protein